MQDIIIIDKIECNPYFVLGVTPDDNIEHITKMYREKAKRAHPDKMSKEDKKSSKKVAERIQYFKIVVQCFEYLQNKKQNFMQVNRNTHVTPSSVDMNIPLESFENQNQADNFNKSFEKLRVSNPNDFGYEVKDRLTKVDDYEKFSYKPIKQFDSKQFDQGSFNKTFEYNKFQYEKDSKINEERQIIHKTTDGFAGYNSASLGGCASVSSYNGLLLVGDNFGKSGVGYSDTNFSDYQQSFQAAGNPNKKVSVPETFVANPLKDAPLTASQMTKQVNRQLQNRGNIEVNNSGPSRSNFESAQEELLRRQQLELEQKIGQDREFILQYQGLYDQNTLQSAFSGNLITSPDYTPGTQPPQQQDPDWSRQGSNTRNRR